VQKRILVMGEDRWSIWLAEGLTSLFPDEVTCRTVAMSSRSAVGRALRLLFWADVVVRVGYPPPVFHYPEYDDQAGSQALTAREGLKRWLFRRAFGRGLRWVVLRSRMETEWKRRLIVDLVLRRVRGFRRNLSEFVYWIGTDVQDVVKRVTSGDLPAAYVDRLNRVRNITGAGRLTEELGSIGVTAQTVPYPGRMLESPRTPTPMPDTMTVLSYVPDTRQGFYGLPSLLAAAESLPDVEFSIMGGYGTGLAYVPSNVRFYGYIDDPTPLYERASVVVRLVEHDGAGYSMAEGLLFARPVIYSYATPYVIHVEHGDSAGLLAALTELRSLHGLGGIPLNLDGREWALQEYDPTRRYTKLCAVLTGAACC